MYTEELVEDGIVTEVNDGLANVTVTESDFCEECSAKIFCHSDSNTRTVTVKDPYGVKPGDNVRISIKGRSVIAVSILLYGLPLLILVLGIFLGTKTIENHSEVYSSILGITLVAVYFFTIYLISKSVKAKNKFLPNIVFVSSHKNNSKDEVNSKIT